MFPVHIKKPGASLPDDSIYYVVARNGLFLHKESEWASATVPVKQIAILDNEEPSISLHLPPLDHEIFFQAVQFFRHIYKTMHTEAAVLLHYSADAGWAFSVPSQRVAFASVRYNANERLDGYQCVGTMHSHGSMSAFHSSTDVNDEAEWDGVHVTIGGFRHHTDTFAMSAEVVINGHRFPLDAGWFLGLKECETPKSPFAYITKWNKPTIEYSVACPESLTEWAVPQEWIDQIEQIPKPQIFTYGRLDSDAATKDILLPAECAGDGFPPLHEIQPSGEKK
jgi:hypothetical protein